MNGEYREIDIMELMRQIWKRWWLLALLVAISAIASYCVSKTGITPVYKATTTIFIGKEGNSIAGISLSDLEIGNQLVTDYKELLRTNLVSEEVARELKLKTTPAELNRYLQVETIKDSRLMHISYKDPNPEMAVKIADKFSDILKEKAESIVGVKNIYIVDYAALPQKPDSPNIIINVAIACILGFIAAISVIVLGMMLDNAVHKEDEIEKEIGLPVLGTIPKFKGELRV